MLPAALSTTVTGLRRTFVGAAAVVLVVAVSITTTRDSAVPVTDDGTLYVEFHARVAAGDAGQGTLGARLNDDSISRQVERLLVNATDSLEELRQYPTDGLMLPVIRTPKPLFDETDEDLTRKLETILGIAPPIVEPESSLKDLEREIREFISQNEGK
jgi:hypothetical protein